MIFNKGTTERDFMKALHFMFGLTVLLLVLLRLLARRLSPKPEPQFLSGFSKPSAIASRVGHAALYVFMCVMPLMDWMVLSAAGNLIPFFGLELPVLIAPDEALAKQLKALHETAGSVGYFLIGVHVVAALFHQVVLKDNLLARMRMR